MTAPRIAPPKAPLQPFLALAPALALALALALASVAQLSAQPRVLGSRPTDAVVRAVNVLPQRPAATVATRRLSPTVRRILERGDLLSVQASGDTMRVPADAEQLVFEPGVTYLGTGGAPALITEPATLDLLRRSAGLAATEEIIAIRTGVVTIERLASGEVRVVESYVRPQPIRYVKEEKRFRGRAFIGVRVIEGGSSEVTPLDVPMGLSVTSSEADVTPSRVEFVQLNGAPKEVLLETEVEADSILLRLTHDGLVGTDRAVGVPLQPRVRMSGVPVRIQGLGVERRIFRATVLGRTREAPYHVTFGMRSGAIEPRQGDVPSGSSIELTISPDDLGADTITAEGRDLSPTEVAISVVFPWRYLAAMLIGGLLGAGWAFAATRARGGKRRLGWSFLAALLGACLGTVVAIGLGLNLSWFQIGAVRTTIAIVALSALLAATGLKLVPWRRPTEG